MNSTKKIAVWNTLLVLSMATMVLAVLYDRFVPYPRFATTGRAIADQENRIRQQSNALYEDFRESTDYLESRLWTGDEKLVGPRAMSIATRLSEKHQIKLSAFRPQKSIQEGTLVRLPFVVSLEGSYPQVVAWVRDIESPSNKLVVNVVQIASTDGASSAVNAVVNVWAFQESKAIVKPKSTKKSGM